MKEFLNRQNLQLIIICYLATSVSLLAELHPVVFAFGALFVVWRVGIYLGRLGMASVWVVRLVSVASSALVVLLVYKLGIFNLMVHLIMLGYSLKFLELRSKRDVKVYICTGLLLVAGFYIYHNSMLMALLGFAVAFLHLLLLLSLYNPENKLKLQFSYLSKLCLVSIPLSIGLFVLIPRLSPIWQVPLSGQAKTGLTDKVSPGEISNLSRSSKLAFRASFDGSPPPASQRYWRAFVFDIFDGASWYQSDTAKSWVRDRDLVMPFRGGATNYRVIVEPTQQHWLPVLDISRDKANSYILPDYSIRTLLPVSRREQFELAYYPGGKLEHKPNQGWLYLSLPASGNERTRSWVAELKTLGLSERELIGLVLNRYTGESYSYTLNPPRLRGDQIDKFLFDSQAGFCVHYAASFVYIMRELGIPARMVTGYLGGEWDEGGGFMTVRQYDAHAWAEVWLAGQGWVRYDPTAYVAPERVESGLENALTEPDEFLAGDLSLIRFKSVAWLNELRLNLAQMDYYWAVWVLNYNGERQYKLLNQILGRVSWGRFAILFGLIFVACISLMLLMSFHPWQKSKQNKEDRLYFQFIDRMKGQGIERLNWETPSLFAQRIAQLNPEASRLSEEITGLYNRLKFEPHLDKTTRKMLLKKLAQLVRNNSKQA